MRVLIGLDDQSTAEQVVKFVREHNWTPDTEFKLVYALSPIMVHHPMASEPRMMEVLEEVAEQNARKLLHNTAENLKSELGIVAQKDLCVGMPATVLVERAKKWPADLVIVATHGRRGFDKFIYGSVAGDVAAAAPCSVAVLMLPAECKTPPAVCSQC